MAVGYLCFPLSDPDVIVVKCLVSLFIVCVYQRNDYILKVYDHRVSQMEILPNPYSLPRLRVTASLVFSVFYEHVI